MSNINIQNHMQNETHPIQTDSLLTDQILYQRFKQEFKINMHNEEPIIVVQQKEQLNQNGVLKNLLENFINLDIKIEDKIENQTNPAQQLKQNSAEQFKKQEKFIPQIQILNQKQQSKQQSSVSEYQFFYHEYYDPIIFNSSFTARNQISETQRKSYLSIPVNQWSLALLQQNYSKLQNNNITVDKKFAKNISFEIKHSTINAKIIQIQVRLSYFVFVIKIANFQQAFNQYSKNLVQIGFGSYGIIYGYFDEQLRKNIALKQIKIFQSLGQLSESCQYNIKPFLLEFCIYKLLSVLKLGLQIPNIFGFDAICFQDSMIFPMEYAKSIFKLKNKQVKNLSPNFVQNLIQSLYFLHSFHIIHQDIKPNNVMYSTVNNKIVLIDFGISDVIAQKVGEKTWTNFVGTYQYCSQEMRKLFYSKNSHPIDLYWNDTVGLQSTLNFITQKVMFIKKYQSVENQSVQNRVWPIDCQERILLDSEDFLNELQEKINDVKAHETLIEQHKKKAQKKSSLNLFIILKVIYNIYTQNEENIKRILSSNKQIIQRRRTSQTIASFMLDISPSIKLFKIFIQYFYPMWSDGFTSSVEINLILDIYKNVNALSAAKLHYFSAIQNLFLVRYNLAYEQTNKTKKSTQLSKYNQIMGQQSNQNKYINFMNILIWLESLNFYEQEENFISQLQILKAVKKVAKNILGTANCEQKLPVLLVRVLQSIWNSTYEYLRFYSNIQSSPQKDQNQTTHENRNIKEQRFFYKSLKNDQIEQQKYENFKRKVKQQTEKQQKKTNPAQSFQVYELNFILEFLPEILFKICKIYQRLQLFKRFIIKIKLYSLFTRDFNRLTMTFYYIVKYSYMNFHQQYDLQYIIRDLNFMFSLNHKNIIPKIVQNYENKIIEQAQKTKRKVEEDKLFSKFNKVSQEKKQDIKKDPKVTFFAFQVVLKDLQSISKQTKYQHLNQKYFSENVIINEERLVLQQSESKQMSFIDFIERIDISQKCKGEMEFDKLKAFNKNQANNIQSLNQNSFLCKKEENQKKQFNYLNLDSLKKEEIEQHVFKEYIDLDSKFIHNNEELNRQAFNIILEKIKSKGKQKLKKQKQLKNKKNLSYQRDLFERVINGQPEQFVHQSKMDKGFDYIQMIINILLSNAKELSLYSSNLFKLILMVLRDIFVEIMKAQAYHVGNKPSLTIKDPQKMKQITKTIRFYIKYISSEQCWIQKMYKDQLLQDLTVSLFQCALFGQIKQLVETCEEFIGNKSKIRVTDTKKQEFFLLIAAKYQTVFPELAQRYSNKIKRKNVFGMKSRFSYQLMAMRIDTLMFFQSVSRFFCQKLIIYGFQLKVKGKERTLGTTKAVKQLNFRSTKEEGQRIICKLLNYFILLFNPKQSRQSLRNREHWILFDECQQLDFSQEELLQTESLIESRQESVNYLKSLEKMRQKLVINLALFKKIEFLFFQLDSFEKVRLYYDLVELALRSINDQMGGFFDERQIMLFLGHLKQYYIVKLTQQIQNRSQKEEASIKQLREGQNSIKNINSNTKNSNVLAHLNFFEQQMDLVQRNLSLPLQIGLIPCYYWQVKSQLLKHIYGRQYQLLYLDQFLMNDYYLKSDSFVIGNQIKLNSLTVGNFYQKKDIQGQRESEYGKNLDQNDSLKYEDLQTAYMKRSEFTYYSSYFPPNLYEKYFRLLREYNQERPQRSYLNHFSNTNDPLPSSLSLYISSLDTFYRHLSFINYMAKNLFESVYLMPETLSTQSCFLDSCLLHDQFELLYRHLMLLIQLMARFRPFRNVIATNVALRIMQKFLQIHHMDYNQRFAKMVSFGHFIIQKRQNIVQNFHYYESHINPYSIYFHLLLSRNILSHSASFVFFKTQKTVIVQQLTKFRKHFLKCVNDLRNFYHREGSNEASRKQVKNDKCSKGKTQKHQTHQTNTSSSGIQITLVAKEFQVSLNNLCIEFNSKFNLNKLKKLQQNPKISYITKLNSLTRNDYILINSNLGNQPLFYENQLKQSTQTYIISRLKAKVIKKQLNLTS